MKASFFVIVKSTNHKSKSMHTKNAERSDEKLDLLCCSGIYTVSKRLSI